MPEINRPNNFIYNGKELHRRLPQTGIELNNRSPAPVTPNLNGEILVRVNGL